MPRGRVATRQKKIVAGVDGGVKTIYSPLHRSSGHLFLWDVSQQIFSNVFPKDFIVTSRFATSLRNCFGSGAAVRIAGMKLHAPSKALWQPTGAVGHQPSEACLRDPREQTTIPGEGTA